jgi:hypothetical protein
MSAKLARDLRSAERHSCQVQTTCQPPSAWRKDPWPATIRDISTGGLSLRLNRRFEPGAGLAVELPTEEGGTNTILARVAHANPGEGGSWILGCKFISELSDEEVRTVLGQGAVNVAPIDDASLPETPGQQPLEDVLFQTRLHGQVLRWYVKRLDLAGDWPPPSGKVVRFRVGGLPADTPPVELTIKKCQPFRSSWLVNCKFRQPPAEAVLQALTAPRGALA